MEKFQGNRTTAKNNVRSTYERYDVKYVREYVRRRGYMLASEDDRCRS